MRKDFSIQFLPSLSLSFTQLKPSLDNLHSFAVLYHSGGFIVFGGSEDVGDLRTGYSGYRLDSIARFDEESKKWSKIGVLNTKRSSLSVIYDGDAFLVVGGDSSAEIEKCQFNEAQMTCSDYTERLKGYTKNTVLFLIDRKY